MNPKNVKFSINGKGSEEEHSHLQRWIASLLSEAIKNTKIDLSSEDITKLKDNIDINDDLSGRLKKMCENYEFPPQNELLFIIKDTFFSIFPKILNKEISKETLEKIFEITKIEKALEYFYNQDSPLIYEISKLQNEKANISLVANTGIELINISNNYSLLLDEIFNKIIAERSHFTLKRDEFIKKSYDLMEEYVGKLIEGIAKVQSEIKASQKITPDYIFFATYSPGRGKDNIIVKRQRIKKYVDLEDLILENEDVFEEEDFLGLNDRKKISDENIDKFIEEEIIKEYLCVDKYKEKIKVVEKTIESKAEKNKHLSFIHIPVIIDEEKGKKEGLLSFVYYRMKDEKIVLSKAEVKAFESLEDILDKNIRILQDKIERYIDTLILLKEVTGKEVSGEITKKSKKTSDIQTLISNIKERIDEVYRLYENVFDPKDRLVGKVSYGGNEYEVDKVYFKDILKQTFKKLLENRGIDINDIMKTTFDIVTDYIPMGLNGEAKDIMSITTSACTLLDIDLKENLEQKTYEVQKKLSEKPITILELGEFLKSLKQEQIPSLAMRILNDVDGNPLTVAGEIKDLSEKSALDIYTNLLDCAIVYTTLYLHLKKEGKDMTKAKERTLQIMYRDFPDFIDYLQ